MDNFDDVTMEDILKMLLEGNAQVSVVSREQLKEFIAGQGDETIEWIDKNITDKHKADVAVFNYMLEGNVTH